MITRNLIDLPNYPQLVGITRKAQVRQSIRNDASNCIDLDLNIFHYKDGVQINYLPNDVKLSADNNDFVNPQTGTKVDKVPVLDSETQEQIGEEYPEGSIGEYDYLWNLVNVLKVKTQVELEEIYILNRVETINEKLYK